MDATTTASGVAANGMVSSQVDILLVDDRQENLLALEAILSDLHQNHIKVKSGEEALREVLDHDFAVILLDVQMAGMDGFETARLIRNRDKSRHTPIIFLTAHDVGMFPVADAYALGAVDYLTKPLVPAILRSKVSVFVELFQKTRQVKAQAERLQAEAESNLKLMIESVKDYAILSIDREGRVSTWNAGAERLFGWPESEILGTDVAVLFTQEDRAQGIHRLEMERAAKEGKAEDERWHVRKDGSRFFVSGMVRPIRDSSGTLRGFTKVARDMTEWRRATLLMADAGAYAESIVDTVREPMLVLTSELKVRSANRSFYETFGLTPEETEDRFVYDLGKRQWNIPELKRLFEEILPNHTELRDFEVAHDFKDFGRRHLLLNARKVWREGNHTELILLAIEDITEQRRAEAEAFESKELYRLIVECAEDFAIFTTDAEGRVTMWNPGAAKILGYSAEEILGKDARVIFTPEDLEHEQDGAEMRTALAECKAVDERWLVRKDGRRFFASGLLMPLRDDSGHFRGFLKILRDITARKEAEDALRSHARDLAEADQRKNEFLAMLAHELRNPLSAIRGAVELWGKTTKKEHLDWTREVIERQTSHLTRLIDDLLDVSRVSQGKIHLKKEAVELRPLVEQAYELAREVIDRKHHELAMSLPEEPVYFEADPTRIEQVLENLLANSAKYMEDGGHIELSAREEGSEVVFTVRDRGIGIQAEMLPHVFGLFTQVNASLDRSQGGLGIGLTLVKQLVEMHGGSVTAESDGVGRGSTFTVRLPVGNPERKEAEDKTKEGAGEKRRVLVVDDNVDSAQLTAQLLEYEGHEVEIAHDGLKGIELARSLRPDIILLDIGLPGMDGYQIAERLRTESCCEGSLIIAVSGYGEERAKERSREAGFDYHLTKPVDPEGLLRLVCSDRA